MNKARDLLALSIIAYQQGEFEAAAKFFSSAMGSDDLDSFVDHIGISVPRSARNGIVPPSENTLSPSLASVMDDEEMEDIVNIVEARFRAECSLFDEGDEEVEVRAADDDEEDFLESEASDDTDSEEEEEDFESEASGSDRERPVEYSLKIVEASAGPVRIK